MKRLVFLACAFFAACSSSSPTGDLASIHGAEFVVPAGWLKHEDSPAMAKWAPSDNERKESITVIAVQAPKLESFAIRDLLVHAQRGLPGSAFSAPTAFSTRQGLVGFRIEGDFVPAGQSERYRRIHAAVVGLWPRRLQWASDFAG